MGSACVPTYRAARTGTVNEKVAAWPGVDFTHGRPPANDVCSSTAMVFPSSAVPLPSTCAGASVPPAAARRQCHHPDATVVGYRVKQHLTQTQFARLLGMRQRHVARLEMGEHTPSIETLQHHARVLGLRFIIDVAPAERVAQAGQFAAPPGIEVVEEVTAGALRVLVATG